MNKFAELQQEMRGRVMARAFWNEHEKIAAGFATALQRAGKRMRKVVKKAPAGSMIGKVRAAGQKQLGNISAYEKATERMISKATPGIRSSAKEVGKAIGL